MKVYIVVGRSAHVGFGERIALTKAQFAAREHNLDRVETDSDGDGIAVLAVPKAVLEFKQGEIFGLSEVPKSQAAALQEFEGKKVKKDLRAFLDAVAEIPEEAAGDDGGAAEEPQQTDADKAEIETWTAEWNKDADLQKEYPKLDDFIAAMKGDGAGNE